MSRIRTGVLMAILAAATAAPAAAQRAPGARGYDPATVETVSGTIERIDTIATRRAGPGGVHVQLRTTTETIAVHLGPGAYMERQALRLAVGDRVTVRGSRMTFAGAPAIVAASVRRGADELSLRDSLGVPRWARAGGRRP